MKNNGYNSLMAPDCELMFVCMCTVVNTMSVTIATQEIGVSGTNINCSGKARGGAGGI